MHGRDAKVEKQHFSGGTSFPLSLRRSNFPQLLGVAEQAAHIFLNLPSPLPTQWVSTSCGFSGGFLGR